MKVYLANIVLILFWRMFLYGQKYRASRKIYCGIVALQWILISGLRGWDVGADTHNYYLIFESIKDSSWGEVLRTLMGYLFLGQDANDPGYTVLIKLFQVFFGSYQLFLLVIAAVFTILMARWIYKYSSSPCTSFIIYSTLFYSFFAVTGHRQVLATALIVFVGYDQIKERNWKKFALVAFVSFLIHKSSLVFVPFYFLVRIPITTGYVLGSTAGVAMAAFLGKSLYGPIAAWLGYGKKQINYAKGGAELYAFLLIALSVVTLLLYPKIKKHRKDADYLFHATLMTLLTALFVLQNQSFMRIQQYFSLFMMITIPEVINTVKRRYRLIVYLLFGAIMILYLIRNNPSYSFFFA